MDHTTEELKLIAAVDEASERIAELANRLPRNADERHDLRIDREAAVSRYEDACDALHEFWGRLDVQDVAADAAALSLEDVEAMAARRDAQEAEEMFTEGRRHRPLPVNPHGD